MTAPRAGCREHREALLEGREASCTEHLARCAACREEAAALRSLYEGLAAIAESEPSRRVDRRLRRVIATPSQGQALALRPVLALLLASCALVSAVGGVSVLLALTPLSDAAPAVASLLVAAYLTLCTIALTPILCAGRRGSYTQREIQP